MSRADQPVLRVRHRVVPGNEWAGWPREDFSEAWLEQRLDEEWTVCFRLAIQNDRAVIAELRVIPSENRWTDDADEFYEPGEWRTETEGPNASVPLGGVKSHHLREIHLLALDSVSSIAEWISQHRPESLPILLEAGVPPSVPRKRPGPVPPSDRELAEFAREYVRTVEMGVRNPHHSIARNRRLSTETVRDKIKEARRRQLLTSLGSGKAGGRLTAKALKVLSQRKKKT